MKNEHGAPWNDYKIICQLIIKCDSEIKELQIISITLIKENQKNYITALDIIVD